MCHRKPRAVTKRLNYRGTLGEGDEVLDRLFLLSAERAAEEQRAAPPPGRGGKSGRRTGRPRKGGAEGQLKIGGLDGEG